MFQVFQGEQCLKVSYNGWTEAEVEEEEPDSTEAEGETYEAYEDEEDENENGRKEKTETTNTEKKEKTKKTNTARTKKTKKTNTARDIEAEEAKDAERKLENERRKSLANAEGAMWFKRLDEKTQREAEENGAGQEEVKLLNHIDGGLTVAGLDDSVRKAASQFTMRMLDALPSWNPLEKHIYGQLKEVKFDCLLCDKTHEDSNQRSTHVKQVHKMKMPKYHEGVLYQMLKKVVDAKKEPEKKEEVVEIAPEIAPINFLDLTPEIEVVDLETQEVGDEEDGPEADDVDEILNSLSDEEDEDKEEKDKEEKEEEEEENEEEDKEEKKEEREANDEEDELEKDEEDEGNEEEDVDDELEERNDGNWTEEVPLAEEEEEREVAEEDMKEEKGGEAVKAQGRRPRRATKMRKAYSSGSAYSAYKMRKARRGRVPQNPPFPYEKKKAKVPVFTRKIKETRESRRL